MIFICEKHNSCIVIHENCNQICPYCESKEEFETELEDLRDKLGSWAQDYSDIESDFSALQDAYDELVKANAT